MKHKFFAISARDPEAAETDMNSFCSQHRVTFVEKQLIMDGAQSFWSVCVTYQTDNASDSKDQRKPRIDYKKELSPPDFRVYLVLHALRKEIAQREGVVHYAIFDNGQLAAMVTQRVSTKDGLAKIANVGKKRLESYGDAFLEKLNECWTQDSLQEADETPQDQS